MLWHARAAGPLRADFTVGLGVPPPVARIAAEPARAAPGLPAHRALPSGKRETLLPFLGWPQLLMILV
jgi:hypothetical protein